MEPKHTDLLGEAALADGRKLTVRASGGDSVKLIQSHPQGKNDWIYFIVQTEEFPRAFDWPAERVVELFKAISSGRVLTKKPRVAVKKNF